MCVAQDKYAEAEPLYKEAIAIGEKTLGKEHPDVAVWYNNLGLLYKKQVCRTFVTPEFLHTFLYHPGVLEL